MILNGDVFSPADLGRSLSATGADSLMLARGALWNPSIFALGFPKANSAATAEGVEAEENAQGSDSGGGGGGSGGGAFPPTVPQMAPQAEVVARYIELGEQMGSPVGNIKYTAMLMMEGSGKTDAFKLVQRAKTPADLRSAALLMKSHPHFTQPGGAFVPAALEPPPDLPDAPSLPVNAWRHVPPGWKPGQAPVRRNKAPVVRAAPAAPAPPQEEDRKEETHSQAAPATAPAPAPAAGVKRSLDEVDTT